MTEEKTTKKGPNDPHTKPGTEQLKDGEDLPSNASAAGDASEEKKTEVNENVSSEEEDDSDICDEGGGSQSDPPTNGNKKNEQQPKARTDTASQQTRSIIQAAKDVSWKGMEQTGMLLVWGSVANRTNGTNDVGWVRVGDRSILVRKPSAQFLALPIGYPVMVNTGKIWKGNGGAATMEKFLVVPPIAKLDMLRIEAAKTKAQCQDFNNEKIFDDNFTHCYYGSSRQNEMRGKIIFDQDNEKIAIMVMEKTSGGNWVTAGKIPIREESFWTKGKLRLGTNVCFTTQVRDKTIFAHKIFPCALLDTNGREHNTYTQLPRHTSPNNDHTFIALLKEPAGKRLEVDRAQLLVSSLSKSYKERLGEEKWSKLGPEMNHTVDVLVTDNIYQSDLYQGAATINFTELIVTFQQERQIRQSPFCWDVMKKLLLKEEAQLLEKKFLETKIGLTVVVEVDESHQKLALKWANNTIERVVNDRGRTSTYVDTLGITYGFGPYIDGQNFWEILNDESFQPGKLAGLHNIKIFDKLIPMEVTFRPEQPEEGLEKLTIFTDRATRGLVVLTAEAVSNWIPEGKRLEVIPTEVDTVASSLLSSQNKFETHIKFRTTTENLLLFNYICRIYNIVTYFDNNPPKHFGRKQAVSWRTVKFLTTGWTDELFSSLLAEINDSEDFFIMKKADIIGKGDKESLTTFTIISENHRSGRMLAALKLQFPELQAMCMNNFITRVAVRGKLDLANLEAGINRVNTVFQRAIKKVVFENKTYDFYASDRQRQQNVTSYKPHFSKYVSALAGFYNVLDRQEVAAFLSLADVEVKDATLTWFYNTAEQDYVLQVQTECPTLIQQLKDREGGQHDVVTFLRWTQELGASLKFAGVLDAQNIPKEAGKVPHPVKKRKLLTVKQIADLTVGTEAEAKKPAEAWTEVQGKRAPKTQPQAVGSRTDAVTFLNNNFSGLDTIEEVEDQEMDDEDTKQGGETSEKGGEQALAQADEGKRHNQSKPSVTYTQKVRTQLKTQLAKTLFDKKLVGSLKQATALVDRKEEIYYKAGLDAEGVHEQIRALTGLEAEVLFKEVSPPDTSSADTSSTRATRKRAKRQHDGGPKETQLNSENDEQPRAEGVGGDDEQVIDNNKNTEVSDITTYFAPRDKQQQEVTIATTATSLINTPNNNGGGK